MRKQLTIALLVSALAAPAIAGEDKHPARGLAAVNVPVVQRTDYAFDVAPSGSGLAASEKARLDAWFAGLGLGYGDRVYVTADASPSTRADVAQVVARYGMLLSAGAPVVEGAAPAGMARVVVSRTRASVPGCPNWSQPAQPNFANRTMSNFGCAVNGNMASMIADPQDLVWGREGGSYGDAATSARAIRSYRNATPTGEKGLQEINTKEEE